MSIIREFHEIKDFDGYFVNKDGLIVSKNVGTIIRQIRPQIHSSGYLNVKLKRNDGKLVHLFVHRIVAKAFLPNEKETVNHINMDKTKNNVENLEWATRSENCKEAYRLKGKTTKTPCNLFKNEELIGNFESIRKACIYVDENIESVSINSMLNSVRVGIKPYKGKYTIDRV